MFTSNTKNKEYFVENLSILIDSGVNISEALSIIFSGIDGKGFKEKILSLREYIDSGFNLWQALEKIKIFSSRDISLVKIGEESGHLGENLKILSGQYQKEKIFRSKVYSALMYPVIVLSMVLVIGFGMSWFLLPKLALIFTQLDIELPLLTRIMISVGLFFQSYGIIFFPVVFGLIILMFYLFFINKKTKYIGQNFLFNIFVTKKLIVESELSRFGFILGVLLGAGFSITEALKSMEQSSPYHFYKKIYKHLSNKISEGLSFRESMISYRKINRYIPLPIQQIIFVGEKSGRLSESFSKIGKNYEEKLDLTTKNLAVALEPILLVIVWVGVLFLALAIILPVYNLIGQIN
ncbi:MAG TPA: type II secretion system F family protein [bacterium]|nr:type II secretion system F family protein [bacterium]